jgi:AhpC/TSA family
MPPAATVVTMLLACGLAVLAGPATRGQTPDPRPHDLDRRPVDPFRDAPDTLVVLVFVQADCPVSNRYAPELQRLQRRFEPRGAAFWLIYPDPAEDAAAIREHLRAYGHTMRALRDPRHHLVARAQARVTPEAAVFTAGGRLLYHGRIDNRYVDFGRVRPAPTTRDLEAALEAALAGRAPPRDSAPAVGCLMTDLR